MSLYTESVVQELRNRITEQAQQISTLHRELEHARAENVSLREQLAQAKSVY